MSSTRSKNTSGNYQLEQYQFEQQKIYDSYIGRVVNNTNYLPGDGLLSGRCPSTILSYNYTDIESELFGVGSTNLVNPKLPTKPSFKNMKSLSIYDKQIIIIPEPLIIEKYQRPLHH
jgi:hypothetical protein